MKNIAFKIACEVRNKSYSPYSNFKVGAAVKAKSYDEIFTGCNVENTSYGATICAERVAINNMISKIGKAELEFIVVVADHKTIITPCGICLQVISEFSNPDLCVYLANTGGIQSQVMISDLLKMPFKLFSKDKIDNKI